jgi:hypothetical protein
MLRDNAAKAEFALLPMRGIDLDQTEQSLVLASPLDTGSILAAAIVLVRTDNGSVALARGRRFLARMFDRSQAGRICPANA